MAVLSALCKPHSVSKQKLSEPVHSTFLDDFDITPSFYHILNSDLIRTKSRNYSDYPKAHSDKMQCTDSASIIDI